MMAIEEGLHPRRDVSRGPSARANKVGCCWMRPGRLAASEPFRLIASHNAEMNCHAPPIRPDTSRQHQGVLTCIVPIGSQTADRLLEAKIETMHRQSGLY
jgi:hypothetical protein